MHPSLRPFLAPEHATEIEILCLACGTAPSDESLESVESKLLERVDWDFLLQAATFHGVVATVFANLQKHMKRHVPAQRLKQLGAINDRLARHNLLLFGEMCQLQDLFEQAGVPFVPFKGAVVAAAHYQDICLRAFGDIDLLVEQKNLDRAQRLLISRGYRRLPKLDVLHSEDFYRSQQFKNSTNEQSFQLGNTDAILDLHWAVQPRRYLPLDTSEVINSCKSVNIHGRSFKTLTPELELAVLSAHGCRHHWNHLTWLCDIRQIIQGGLVDWSSAFKLTASLDAEKMLLLAVAAVEQFFDCSMPADLLVLYDPSVVKFARKVAQKLHILEDKPTGYLMASVEMVLQLRRRPESKILFLFDEFLAPEIVDLNRFRLPSILHPLYYFLHPLSLLEGATQRRWRDRFRPQSDSSADLITDSIADSAVVSVADSAEDSEIALTLSS